MAPPRQHVAVGVFALICTSAPIAFGAVDRSVQIVLVALFTAGLCVMPVEFPRWSRRAAWALAAVFVVLLAKEFAPAAWFGSTAWRTSATGEFQLLLPGSHHPEPGRALDGLLALMLGAGWFAWVRTLARDRDLRLNLAWCMLAAGAALALVCLVMNGFPQERYLIFGLRYTPGWAGFGSFPNRNHTACFLAMSALVGCGCVARAGSRKQRGGVATGLALIALTLVALLQSRSRGGLVAFLVGAVVFAAFALRKSRDRKTVAVVIAGALVVATTAMIFGTNVLARFGDAKEGDLPTNLRWSIWHDTLAMWRDAPLFGHGLDAFAHVFPFYQKLKLENRMLDNQMILHPESSWLLALVEMGALLLAAGVVALSFFLAKNLRIAARSERGFFVRAGGFAAVAVLLVQSAWDVPAHRWGTLGFGLAALALACPASSRSPHFMPGKKLALLPLALAIFWMLPFFVRAPFWSPTVASRLLLRAEDAPGSVSEADLSRAVRWFPLDPELHYFRGAAALGQPGGMAVAWRDFSIAARLRPASWNLPAGAAAMSQTASSGMALHFWSVAVEHAGARAEEVLALACRSTLGGTDAELFWSGFVETHPRLLLAFALSVPEEKNARELYERWWKTRAFTAPLDRPEIENFYRCLARFGTRAQLNEWMQRRRELEPADFRAWAVMLHEWKDDAAAWTLLSASIKEPPFPESKKAKPEIIESHYKADVNDPVNAQQLAELLARTGEAERAQQIIFQIAASPDAPPWFLEKAAYAHAAAGNFGEAVTALLREK